MKGRGCSAEKPEYSPEINFHDYIGAISTLNAEAEIRDIRTVDLFKKAKFEIKRIGLGEFAAALGVDPSNLAKVSNGESSVQL